MPYILLFAILTVLTKFGCINSDPYGQAAIESLRNEDVRDAFEQSVLAMNDGSTDELVCYIAAMATFYEGDLLACMDYANRITENDTLYSRARVIYTSAWVQQYPQESIPKGLLDSLEKQIKAETDEQNLSVLFEARQIVYRQLWRQTDTASDEHTEHMAEMMLSAMKAVAHDSVSLPSWMLLSEYDIIIEYPKLTELLYRTAKDIAGDDRLMLSSKQGILYVAMWTAANQGRVELLRELARVYIRLDLSSEQSGFISIASLNTNASVSESTELLSKALKQSSSLQETFLQSAFPRILIPRL